MSEGICRDCLALVSPDARRCPVCGHPRLLFHPELHDLTIAHMDCDAFYATVEKRDNPELLDKPLIVGGGKRGVVSAACYIARTYGVRSAMPMFKALKACPHAVVIPPDIAKYARVGREVRNLMLETTPLVEPLSIDEAFLDLTGTERLHHASAAVTLARLARRIQNEIGVSVSIGLSFNKFLAKTASDLDKPRGFSIIGRTGVMEFLAAKPVSFIWGVGKSLEAKLARDGITSIAQLQRMDEHTLMVRYGAMGTRLHRLSRGLDSRDVSPDRETKSISAETTFLDDVCDEKKLDATLWRLCEKLSTRAKAQQLAGKTVVLKLKTADFSLRTRSLTLPDPTQLAETIYRAAHPLLLKEADGTAFRLIGIGISSLCDPAGADPLDMFDPDAEKRAVIERTIDQVREKFGPGAIGKGRGRT
ncbi:MAG: DNA polymerase IV [Parvibaculaceae bacterium]|nr:DNA polymerase IV [Parvibaculaceae bacterium]